MNRSHSLTTIRLFTLAKPILLFQVGCVALLFFLSTVTAAENSSVSQPANTSHPPYEYQLENRPDPFAPFITEKAAAASVDMNEIVDENGPLTGMQLFEPGQLTLVALLKKDAEDMAMVEDFTGKGYVLTEGTKIGRRGIVKDIAPKSVIIEETAVTRAGNKITTEVVMLLKKEGEE